MNENKPQEKIIILLENNNLRIERIYSFGAISPSKFWYDEPLAEWVALIKGSARIKFLDKEITLNAGDCYFIEPHIKHQVSYTSYDCEWLCVYIK